MPPPPRRGRRRPDPGRTRPGGSALARACGGGGKRGLGAAGEALQHVQAVLGQALQAGGRGQFAGDPAAHHRIGGGPDVVGRIERRATPSTVTMVFCSSTSSGRRRMSNRAVISNSWVSTRPMDTSAAAWPKIGSPTARMAWAKASTDGARAHSRPGNGPGHARIVALQEPPENLRQIAALRRTSRPMMPKSTAISRDRRDGEQVALVQVGVKHPVVQGLGRKARVRLNGQGRPFQAGLLQAPQGGSGSPAAHARVSTRSATPSQTTCRRAHVGSRAITSPSSSRRPPPAAGPAPAARERPLWRPGRAAPGGGRRAPALGQAGRQGHRPDVGRTRVPRPAQNLTATLRPSSRRAGWA